VPRSFSEPRPDALALVLWLTPADELASRYPLRLGLFPAPKDVAS